MCIDFFVPKEFQSTPSPRRATSFCRNSDNSSDDFNPRPPRGGRPGKFVQFKLIKSFQSTPSPRRATIPLPCAVQSRRFQSTPSPRRATCRHRPKMAARLYFNPRPPRGGRLDALCQIVPCRSFQSTPSPRRATKFSLCRLCVLQISIHALPAEGDDALFQFRFLTFHFNPRPPRGGRRQIRRVPAKRPHHFNPRPPRGGRQQKQLNFNLFFAHFREKFQSIGQKYPALNISIILFWCKNNKIQVRTSQHFLCAFASHQRIRTSSGK